MWNEIMKLQIKDVWTERYLSGFSFGYSWSRSIPGMNSLWHLVASVGPEGILPKEPNMTFLLKNDISWHFTEMTGMGTHNATQPISFEHSIFQVRCSCLSPRMVQDGPGCPCCCQDVPGRARAPQKVPQVPQGQDCPGTLRTVSCYPGLRRGSGRPSCCPGDCWRGPWALHL